MYISSEYRDVEPKCYDADHISQVEALIKKNFPGYFKSFLDSGTGGISMEQFAELQIHFGVRPERQRKGNRSQRETYIEIITDSVSGFLKDRQKYLDIFDEEALEEYEDEPGVFKTEILKNQCPIIRKTYANKRAKELDKYRKDFNLSSADKLLTVVQNLYQFGTNYYTDFYQRDSYEDIDAYKGLNIEALDGEDYTAYGVIGGGIKSHMLYKVWPEVFPSRSRAAIWALWYLTEKQTFGFRTDSEFLMIDTRKTITQQNYFYPYSLFGWYAFIIYKLLRDEATRLGAYIDPEYRYVIVDRFFDYISETHSDEISLFQRQIANEGRGFD